MADWPDSPGGPNFSSKRGYVLRIPKRLQMHASPPTAERDLLDVAVYKAKTTKETNAIRLLSPSPIPIFEESLDGINGVGMLVPLDGGKGAAPTVVW